MEPKLPITRSAEGYPERVNEFLRRVSMVMFKDVKWIVVVVCVCVCVCVFNVEDSFQDISALCYRDQSKYSHWSRHAEHNTRSKHVCPSYV